MKFGRAFRRLVNLPTPSDARIERDVQDELSFHIEMRTRELVRLGQSVDDARRQASVELGDAERWQRILAREDRHARRDQRLVRWLGDFAFDVRFSIRQLARSPLFAVVAILTVAIGIARE